MILTIGDIAGGRNVHAGMFADLTPKELIRWGWDDDGAFWVQFAVNLSAEEEAAIRLRCRTSSAAQEGMHRTALTAIDTLQGFVNLAAPTQAQTVAAIKTLCRVQIAVIRLVLRELNTTE